MKTLRLLLTFYKSFAFASVIITLSCMSIIFTEGIKTITALIWFKIVTLFLIFFFINNYKRNEFYYYQNLGISKLFLWISTMAMDIIMFLLLITITLMIR